MNKNKNEHTTPTGQEKHNVVSATLACNCCISPVNSTVRSENSIAMTGVLLRLYVAFATCDSLGCGFIVVHFLCMQIFYHQFQWQQKFTFPSFTIYMPIHSDRPTYLSEIWSWIHDFMHVFVREYLRCSPMVAKSVKLLLTSNWTFGTFKYEFGILPQQFGKCVSHLVAHKIRII